MKRRDNETGEVIDAVSYKEWLAAQKQPENTGKTFKKDGNYGIIELSEEQSRQRFKTTQEIADHFAYTDQWGDRQQFIDVASWATLDIETQNRLANAIDYMYDLFPKAPKPNMIHTEELGNKTYGIAHLIDRIIGINPKKMDYGNDYGTMAHELTHLFDYVFSGTAEETYKAALKDMGLRIRSRETDNQLYKLLGAQGYMKYKNDYEEILAIAIEKEAIGQHSELSGKMMEALIRRANKNG